MNDRKLGERVCDVLFDIKWRSRDLVKHPLLGVGHFECFNNNGRKVWSFWDIKYPCINTSTPEMYQKLGRMFLKNRVGDLTKLLKLDNYEQLKLAALFACYKENGSLNEKLLPTAAAP